MMPNNIMGVGLFSKAGTLSGDYGTNTEVQLGELHASMNSGLHTKNRPVHNRRRQRQTGYVAATMHFTVLCGYKHNFVP